MPKAELHLHIKGVLEPAMKFELAARNGLSLPYNTVDEVVAAYDFDDLTSFLNARYEGDGVLITERDGQKRASVAVSCSQEGHTEVWTMLPPRQAPGGTDLSEGCVRVYAIRLTGSPAPISTYRPRPKVRRALQARPGTGIRHARVRSLKDHERGGVRIDVRAAPGWWAEARLNPTT